MFNFIEADTVPRLIPTDDWAKRPAPERSDAETFLHWLQKPKRPSLFKGKPIPAGSLTSDEWRRPQPYIVNLPFPESKMTRRFPKASDSQPVFKGDEPERGPRLLKTREPRIYHEGLNGCGLDLACEAMRDPAQ